MKWISIRLLTMAVALLTRGTAKAESEAPQSPQPAAASPATRPARPQPALQSPEMGFNAGMRQGFGPRFLLPPDVDNPTDQQFKDAEDFVKKFSPNHYAAYQQMNNKGDVGEFRKRIRGAMLHGYLDLKVLEINQFDLYQVKLDQIKTQDDIFGVISRYRQLARVKDSEKARNEVREELRPLEQSLLESRKKESKLRLRHIQAVAEREQNTLEQLERTGPTGIDSIINQEIENGGRPSPFGGFRRRDREQDH